MEFEEKTVYIIYHMDHPLPPVCSDIVERENLLMDGNNRSQQN